MSRVPLDPTGPDRIVRYAPHVRAILTVGLPLILSHLAQFAIGATDTLMLGRYGVTPLAGAVLASSWFFVFLIMGAGFAWAVMPMVAAARDAPEADTQIRRVTRMGLWLSLIFAALALPLLIYAEPLFRAIGQPGAVAAEAGAYLRIAGWGLVPALGVMLLKAYLSALERTRIVLWVTLVAVAVNVAVNWLLIFGNLGFPEMGIRGAALASLAVHAASFGLLALYAVSAFPEHRLFQRLWRPDWGAFAAVFRLGWPIGLTNLAEVGLFSFSAVMVGWVGELPLAAHGIALQLASATFMVHLGLANAATIRAGRAYGRRDGAGLRDGAVAVIALSATFAIVTSAVFLTIPEPLLGLFLDPADPKRGEIVALGATLLVLAAAFQMMDGLQAVALGLLRGVQDTRVPMIHAAVSYWLIGVPLALSGGFVLGLGAVGIWIGLVAGLLAAGSLLLRRFWLRALPAALAATG